MRPILPILLLTLTVVGTAVVPPAAAVTPDEQIAAASALVDAGKYEKAAQQLQAFLRANPKHPKAAIAAWVLGQCHTQLKQYARAVPAYEKAAATTKDPALKAKAQLGLGEAAINARSWAKAAPALTAAVQSPALTPEQAALAWFWLGQARFQLGRFAPAAEAFDAVIQKFGSSDLVGDAHYGAGIAALRQKKNDVARERLRAVVDRYPNAEEYAQALLLAAQLDLDAKRYQEARGGFERFLAHAQAKNAAKADREAAEDGLIQALLALKDDAGAAARLEAAAQRLTVPDPDRYRAFLSLGQVRYRQRQYEPALAAYAEAAKAKDPSVAGEGLYWSANALLALNRHAEAAARFAAVPARFPKHRLAARAQLKAGDAFLAAKQVGKAAAAYRAVAARYPTAAEAAEARKALVGLADATEDPGELAAMAAGGGGGEQQRATLKLARLQLTGKKYPQAAATLTKLLAAKPEPAVAGEARYLLGLAHEAQGKAAPAAAALAAAVLLAPAAPWVSDARNRLAGLYLDAKQWAKAEAAAAAALARKPTPQAEQQLRLVRMQALLEQQKWDPALEEGRTLLALNPPPDTVAAVLFTQGWVHEKRAKPEEARPVWERLAGEFPRSAYAPEALMRLGDAHFKAERYAEARDRYARLLADFPKDASAGEARFKLGSALYGLNQAAEAAAEFDAVAADRSAGAYIPEALYWAGVALDKAGKKPEAIQRLSRLVTGYPKHPRVGNARIRLAALKAVAGT